LQLLRYSEARALADTVAAMSGAQAFDLLSNELGLQLDVAGLEHLPATGAALVVANHPTGLADGIALWQTLRSVRKDVVFFANADALRVAPGFTDIIIPIEWRVGERTPSKSREALVRSRAELERGRCVVIFPSGIPAVPSPILVHEQPWLPTFVSLAAKVKAPVVPVAMRARNSLLFYTFCLLNKPLRHMSLFREFINKRGSTFALKFLPPVRYDSRAPGSKDEAALLRSRVTREARELWRANAPE
jgi:putative hemolysin